MLAERRASTRSRFRTRKFEEHGIKGDSKAAIAIKAKFRSLDNSGNGMLEEDELSRLLPGLTDTELHSLFSSVDIDNSGSVSFDEFVDFVFNRGALGAIRRGWQQNPEFKDFHELQTYPTDLPKTPHRRKSQQIIFDGAILFKGVNGVMDGGGMYNGRPSFEWSRKRCIHNKEPLVRSDKSLLDHVSPSGARLARAAAGLFLFYGMNSTQDMVGWFIAESKPPEGDPVKSYLMFNPCPTADTPDLCRAMWQSAEGDRDKRLFCDEHFPLDKKDGVPEDCLIDDELWGEISSEDEGEPEVFNWEEEWIEQPGEKPEHESDWDSDTYLENNKHRAQIGIDARAAREAARLATETKSAWNLEDVVDQNHGKEDQKEEEEVEEEVEADSTSGPMPKRSRQRRRKKDIPGMSLRHAPGFRVRTAVKTIETDHLASTASENRRRGGRKKTNPRMISQRGSITSIPSCDLDQQVDDGDDSDDPRIYEDGEFVDPDFPPGKAALGADMPEVDGWKRLPRLNPDAVLFYRVVPDDVFIQAFAGNVWFLSACAAAAEYPAWVRAMFGYKEELSRSGRYKVRLFHPGKKTFVHLVIDDYVPIRRNSNSPAFAGITSDAEIWVALVEKAFAKMCGSYAQTEWGSHAYGLHYLCGGRNGGSWCRNGPSRWRRSRTVWRGDTSNQINRQVCEGKEEVGDWRDEDEVWIFLRLAMERCYALACGIDKEKTAKNDGCFSLQADRVYSVVGARQVPTKDGWYLRMVLLRNPYGAGKWEGRWSDSSEAWEQNPQVAYYLGHYAPHKDGTFWMSFSDFLEYFDTLEFVRKSLPIQGSNKAKINGLRRGMRKFHERAKKVADIAKAG